MKSGSWFRAAGRPVVIALAMLTLVAAASADWKEKVLYSFKGGTDGAVPVGAVVFDQHGNLYGATQNGGSSSCRSIEQCGTVYQLAPPRSKAIRGRRPCSTFSKGTPAKTAHLRMAAW